MAYPTDKDLKSCLAEIDIQAPSGVIDITIPSEYWMACYCRAVCHYLDFQIIAMRAAIEAAQAFHDAVTSTPRTPINQETAPTTKDEGA